MSILDQYQKKKYINLETYRKNGEGVKTPVWFVEHADKLYVITMADSWKVKRIRREKRVQIAPCLVNGRVIGEWQNAEACETNEPSLLEIVNGLYRKKYGLLNRFYKKQRIKSGNASVTLDINIIDDLSSNLKVYYFNLPWMEGKLHERHIQTNNSFVRNLINHRH